MKRAFWFKNVKEKRIKIWNQFENSNSWSGAWCSILPSTYAPTTTIILWTVFLATRSDSLRTGLPLFLGFNNEVNILSSSYSRQLPNSVAWRSCIILKIRINSTSTPSSFVIPNSTIGLANLLASSYPIYKWNASLLPAQTGAYLYWKFDTSPSTS